MTGCLFPRGQSNLLTRKSIFKLLNELLVICARLSCVSDNPLNQKPGRVRVLHNIQPNDLARAVRQQLQGLETGIRVRSNRGKYDMPWNQSFRVASIARIAGGSPD